MPAAKGKKRREQTDDEEVIFQEQPLQGAANAAIGQTPIIGLGFQAGMANGLGMPPRYQNAKQFQQSPRMQHEKAIFLIFLKDEGPEYAFDLMAEILAEYDSLVYGLDLRFHVTSLRVSTSQQQFYNR